MTRKTYAQALASMKPDPGRYKNLTRQQLEEAIAAINAQMAGPMPDVERALAYGDRLDMRAALAALAATNR